MLSKYVNGTSSTKLIRIICPIILIEPSLNFYCFYKHLTKNSATSSNLISKTIIKKDFIDLNIKWLAIDGQRFPLSKTTRYSLNIFWSSIWPPRWIFKLSIIIINNGWLFDCNGVHYGWLSSEICGSCCI